jgi:heme-degrading monooxygenase HmoA
MESPVAGGWKYLIVWEFRVRPEMNAEFESAYGPGGTWAAFFSRGAGYVATELNRDQEDSRRYVTLDFWTCRSAYESFRRQHLEQYRAIDATCERMTESEIEVGCFERYGS